MSKIEWTGKTWNCVTGCTEISPGCRNCFARTMHRRLATMGQAKYSEPFHTVRFHPDALDAPLRRKKPTTYFVNSMSDLFHDEVTNEQIAAVFGVMAACPQHRFQCLTKRADRMVKWFGWVDRQQEDEGFGYPSRPQLMTRYVSEKLGREVRASTPLLWPLPNVWLGVSCEDQQRADERVPLLLQTPAEVRFVSLEPLLGPVDLDDMRDWLSPVVRKPQDAPSLDWVIVGGESGPGARLCNIEWIRDIVRQCRAAEVPVFVKQLGAAPAVPGDMPVTHPDFHALEFGLKSKKGGDPSEWPEDLRVREMPEPQR